MDSTSYNLDLRLRVGDFVAIKLESLAEQEPRALYRFRYCCDDESISELHFNRLEKCTWVVMQLAAHT